MSEAVPGNTTGRSARSDAPERHAFALGVVLVLAGVALSRPLLESFTSDGEISGSRNRLVLALAQSVLFATGVGLLWRASRPGVARGAWAFLFVVALAAVWTPFVAPTKADRQRALLEDINRSEDRIQNLSAELAGLRRSALNLTLPDPRARSRFAEHVRVVDLEPSAEGVSANQERSLVREKHWEIEATERAVRRGELALWGPFFEQVAYLDYAAIYIIRGEFDGVGRFETDMGFSSRAHLRTGEVAQIAAKMVVGWREDTTGSEARWVIDAWRTEKFDLKLSERAFFAEVLDSAIPDPARRERATRSLHEELIVTGTLAEDYEWPEYFTTWSQGQHPGVSVVDIDRDGLDDFYVMPRKGRNMLFRNRGDGTFEDIADRIGLDVEDNTACAIFADFDNDGDSDVFLGRSIAPSLYLVNERGSFVDRTSELVDAELPSLVSSASAADYDGDGLLDVYFSTYSILVDMPLIGAAQNGPTPETAPDLPFLGEADEREFYRRCFEDEAHVMHNSPGPPNVLLRNAGGGRFVLDEENDGARVWRHTFQSTFGDYDDDGDADLYVGNDFAPNNLLRNDGGRFTDVTSETGTADIGFGMGVAWGDYDNDGAQDLYVTNMYSKAGRRITGRIAELDPRLTGLAGGNSLLRNCGERFEKVSGTEPPAVLVEKAGWSWGGQFLDFNNDGFLDVYALSGYYTAPAPFRLDFDT